MSDFWISVAASVVASVVFAEFAGWTRPIARYIVRSAAKRAPLNLRDRCLEEWQSHLDEIPSGLSQLVAAAWFVCAAERLREPLATRAAKAGSKLFGFFLLLIMLPTFAWIMVAIRLTSRGPVFYRQEIRRSDGSTFSAYRFRTRGLSDDQAGRRRMARLGRLLRSTRLDTAPAVLNMITGEVRINRDDLSKTVNMLFRED